MNFSNSLKSQEKIKLKDKYYNDFLYPKNELFQHKFHKNFLQFIPNPGIHNVRMQKQQGALLFDTLEYQKRKNEDEFENLTCNEFTDLEDFILKQGNANTLQKIIIKPSCIPDIFYKLKLMGINGSNLYMSTEGVARDVINARNFSLLNNKIRNTEFPRSDLDTTLSRACRLVHDGQLDKATLYFNYAFNKFRSDFDHIIEYYKETIFKYCDNLKEQKEFHNETIFNILSDMNTFIFSLSTKVNNKKEVDKLVDTSIEIANFKDKI